MKTGNKRAGVVGTHTPGPWILQHDDNDIFVEVIDRPTEGVTLATLPVDGAGLANARLIASAPELLDVLLDAETAFDGEEDSVQSEHADLIARIKAAIAKAAQP